MGTRYKVQDVFLLLLLWMAVLMFIVSRIKCQHKFFQV